MQTSTVVLTSPSVKRWIARFEQPFQAIAQSHEAFFQTQQFTRHAAQQHAENKNDGRLGDKGHLHPGNQNAQAQSLKNDGAHAFRQAGAQGHARQSPDRYGQSVDQRTDG